MKGKLILENGVTLEGKIIGDINDAVGNLVFNTAMLGYQELITDPTNKGNILVMTYPMIGNYGINLEDMESDKIHLSAIIIKENAPLPNNFRCEVTLEGFLRQHKIVGLKNIDTRYLTQIIRDNEPMRAIITTRDLTKKEIEDHFNNSKNDAPYSEVGTKDIYEIEGSGSKIGVLDFGLKNGIKAQIISENNHLVVFPWDTKAETILEHNLDGLFLSNGPGNPNDMNGVIQEIKKIVGKLPITGIGLGHLLLSLALDGKVERLKYARIGSNLPVQDIEKNKIHSNAQNTAYYVAEAPHGTKIIHTNLNNGNIEGLRNEDLKTMSVQYYPGSYGSEYVIEEILGMMKGGESVR